MMWQKQERGDGRAVEENGQAIGQAPTRKRSHQHPRRCRAMKKDTKGGVVEGDDERQEARCSDGRRRREWKEGICSGQKVATKVLEELFVIHPTALGCIK
ncbi:hypothetical protein Syun_001189 [Stephania yunnanensis]|uniref:Uncharacterized protein n=1 Tax=Stephania yunnanensis TaxID=152371 RepID=A0AAP0LHC6_9MAGN